MERRTQHRLQRHNLNPLGAIGQLVTSEGFTKLVKIRVFKFSLLGSLGQIGSIFPQISLEFVEKERKHHLDCGIQWYLTIFFLTTSSFIPDSPRIHVPRCHVRFSHSGTLPKIPDRPTTFPNWNKNCHSNFSFRKINWKSYLVGGWTNPFEKYESKWVHLP